jgi:serine/threonine protein kinase
MELVEGKDFLAALRPAPPPDAPTGAYDPLAIPAASPPTSGGLAPMQVCDETLLRDHLRQLGEGLAFLHARDKLHCDLKPSNVMVECGGRVVILDFGLVQETAEAPPTQAEAPAPVGELDPTADLHLTWTRGDAIRGTIGYMSPEQAAGRQLTPASRGRVAVHAPAW